MTREPIPFTEEHMDDLGLWRGGVYETLTVISSPDGPLVRPMGVHVHADGLHVDLYMPSSVGRFLIEGSRFFLSLPAYRDLEVLLSGAPYTAQGHRPLSITVEGEAYHAIEGLPGLLVEASRTVEQTLRDHYGEVNVRRLELVPIATVPPPVPWSPVCRAHGHMLEAAILLTKPSRGAAPQHVREARNTAPDRYRTLLESMENVI